MGGVAWTVNVDLIMDWLNDIDDDTHNQVFAAMELLSESGPSLGRPVVDTVAGSRHKNMKELRPGSSGRKKIRVLFAFDPKRTAIMLVGGDKSGDWSGWYAENIPIADDQFDAHLKDLKEGQT